jgi:hypothetical protein
MTTSASVTDAPGVRWDRSPPFGMNDNVGGDESGHANDEFLRAFGDKYGTGWSPEFPDPFRYCRREGFRPRDREEMSA